MARIKKADGRFVWYELVAADAEAAKAFYSSVVGWGTAEVELAGSAYALFMADETPIAGLTRLQPGARDKGIASHWLGYVAVSDVDAIADRVQALGGTVHVPPIDIPNVSRFSVIGDPSMATLALIKGRQARQEDAEAVGKPGRVVWRELIATDKEHALDFYNALLGWEKAPESSAPTFGYQEFAVGGEAIGGMFDRADGEPFSVWLYYFGVVDLSAAAKRVVTGGGRIIYGPVALPGDIRLVQCLDPEGTVFGLMERRLRFSIGCYAPKEAR